MTFAGVRPSPMNYVHTAGVADDRKRCWCGRCCIQRLRLAIPQPRPLVASQLDCDTSVCAHWRREVKLRQPGHIGAACSSSVSAKACARQRSMGVAGVSQSGSIRVMRHSTMSNSFLNPLCRPLSLDAHRRQRCCRVSIIMDEGDRGRGSGSSTSGGGARTGNEPAISDGGQVCRRLSGNGLAYWRSIHVRSVCDFSEAFHPPSVHRRP